ncbi:MAG: hypothetical protein OK454_09085, partial [Thaumarchaeota archaeon]|nr:hypothetical protein [Nitrososphaerota archaeon]
MLKNLVFIDTETGGLPGLGLDVSRIGLTEVAAYAFDIDPGTWEINERAFLQTYVRPVDGLVYDRFALHLQSTPEREITLDFLDEHGRPEAEVASQLYGFFSYYLPDNAPNFNI